MKLRIKDLYGLRDNEMIFDSGDKKNIIIFAPNGVGKTSIYKGFKDIKNESEYTGREKEKQVPVFDFEYNEEKSISYNSDIKNVENVLLINHIFESLYKPELFDIIAPDEKKKIKEKSEEEIIKFHTEILNEIDIKFHKKILNEIDIDKLLEINRNDYVQILNKYDKYLNKNIINENINNIDSKIESLTKKIEFLTQIYNNINAVANNKMISAKPIGEYFKLKSRNNDEITIDQIINDIKSQKPENYDEFGFKQHNPDNLYDPISQVSNEYLNISKKFTKDEIELIVSIRGMSDELIPKNKNGSFTKGRLATFNKNIINREIPNAYKEKFIFLLNKKRKQIEKIKEALEKKDKEYVSKVNKSIDTLNSLLNDKMLDWSMEFVKIKSMHDELKYIGTTPENIVSNNFEYDFENYASEGQKKIILILAQLIPLFDKQGVVVLDDAMNSFDNQHISELLKAIGNPAFKNVKFLILTHNFELLRSISFDWKLPKESKFFILDKIEDFQYKKIEGNFNEIKNIMTVNRVINSDLEVNKYIKLVAISTLLREAIANILMTNKFPIRGLIDTEKYKEKMNLLDSYNSELVKLIEFIDHHMRHYKRNIKISNLLLKLNNISKNLIETIPAMKKIQNLLEQMKDDGDSGKIFGNEIINQNIKWKKIKTLDEFILSKIFMGTKLRFQIEYVKYYKENDSKIIQWWEDENNWNKAKTSANSKLDSSYINFLAHANNIQWSKIIEYPIYKLLKMNDMKLRRNNEIQM